MSDQEGDIAMSRSPDGSTDHRGGSEDILDGSAPSKYARETRAAAAGGDGAFVPLLVARQAPPRSSQQSLQGAVPFSRCGHAAGLSQVGFAGGECSGRRSLSGEPPRDLFVASLTGRDPKPPPSLAVAPLMNRRMHLLST